MFWNSNFFLLNAVWVYCFKTDALRTWLIHSTLYSKTKKANKLNKLNISFYFVSFQRHVFVVDGRSFNYYELLSQMFKCNRWTLCNFDCIFIKPIARTGRCDFFCVIDYCCKDRGIFKVAKSANRSLVCCLYCCRLDAHSFCCRVGSSEQKITWNCVCDARIQAHIVHDHRHRHFLGDRKLEHLFVCVKKFVVIIALFSFVHADTNTLQL